MRAKLSAFFCGLFLATPCLGTDAPSPSGKELTFTATIVDGKKSWLPAQAVVKAGDKVSISLKNDLAEPHGFTIPGLAQPVVVDAGKTQVVQLDGVKKGDYAFSCQLHPAHVGGKLVVQ